ncbi:FtsX-like permease family protein [Pseudokineococcus lusitanus]|uniref:Putative ABC transport system permease protein n=1 Tax=Pseudokineococcus lusitanus TaxID=763993 RepID=A0A3N1GAK2_9ACTN|nr:FtsX-like permease family protein [Pseudokineococcus lusitanus]ROP27244.1 putative ABC transport system permease protein [Pseudokineococcus lusitanus]
MRQALLPFTGQAAALAVLVAVLAAVAVSAPLVVASSAQGAWEQRQEQVGQAVGTTLTTTVAPQAGPASLRRTAVADLDERVRAAGGRVGLAAPRLTTSLATDLVAEAPDGATTEVQLVTRPGYADAVTLVEGEVTEDGVVAPEELVRRIGARAGDTLELVVPLDRPSEEESLLRVDVVLTGVYEDVTVPLPDFWQGIGSLVVPTVSADELEPSVPPPALLASAETSRRLEQATGSDVFATWYFPTPPGLLVPRVREVSAATRTLQAQLSAPDQPVAALAATLGLAVPEVRTGLPAVVDDVDRTVTLLEPPVRAVGVGGALAAAALVGAWAGARARRREGELRALVARGLSPARGAAQAGAEALLPVLVGLVAGAGLGWGAVVLLGPSPRLPVEVVPTALAVLAVAGVVAVGLVVVVTAAAVARLGRVGLGPAAQLVGRVPWLPVLAAVTVVATVPLVARAVRDDGTVAPGEVDVLTLVVPLLVVVVAAGAVVAVLQRLAPRLLGRARRLPVPALLALRRVVAGPGATRLVTVTTALALGLVTYAGALADSAARTVAVKSSVATGGDVVVDLPRSTDPPSAGDVAALADPGAGVPALTVVGEDQRAEVLPAGVEADVLVVDPGSLADVVRWETRLSSVPLAGLVAALRTGPGGVEGRVPVVAAGDLPEALVDAVDGQLTVDLGGYQVPVQVVGRADAFPGQSSLRPLLVAPWDAYSAALEASDRDPATLVERRVWARGEPGPVLDVLAAAGIAPAGPTADGAVRTAADFATRPELVAQTWSLGYLRAVALAAGLLGLVGLALHAAAQARQRAVAALLLARMGMTTRATAAAAALETGALALLAASVAVAVGLPASALVLRLVDPVPTLPPDPVLAVPWTTVAAVVVGAVVVAGAAGALAARTVRTAALGQVMRDAG